MKSRHPRASHVSGCSGATVRTGNGASLKGADVFMARDYRPRRQPVGRPQRRVGVPRSASFRTSAPSTSAPPVMRRTGRHLAGAEPRPQRSEQHFEQRQQRDLGRRQVARRDHQQHARQAELEEAEHCEQQRRRAAAPMNGKANGSISTAEIAPPMNTAGIRSTDCPRVFSTTTLTAEANGAPSAISMPSTLAARFDAAGCPRTSTRCRPSRWRSRAHVRGGYRRTSARPTRAAPSVSGATASTISVLAVEVSVSASMKQTNMIAHMQPDSSPASRRVAAIRRNRADQQQITADEHRREQAAPERDLEPPLRLQLRRQVARDHARDAPQESAR